MNNSIREIEDLYRDIDGGQVIDRVFRDLVNAYPLSVFRALSGLNATDFRFTDGEITAGNTTLRCDVLGFALVDGVEILGQIEYQSTNASKYEYKMLRYAGAAHERYGDSPKAFLMFLNPEKCRITNGIKGQTINYEFTIFDFKNESPARFLAEATPTCIVFAILCNFEAEGYVINELIERLRQSVPNNEVFEQNLLYLSVLAGRLHPKKMEQVNEAVRSVLSPERVAELKMNMFVQVWNMESRREGREEGIELGREEGIELGREKAREESRILGLKQALKMSRKLKISDETFIREGEISESDWALINNG